MRFGHIDLQFLAQPIGKGAQSQPIENIVAFYQPNAVAQHLIAALTRLNNEKGIDDASRNGEKW